MRLIIQKNRINHEQKDWDEVEKLFKDALNCQTCFHNGIAKKALIDLAQPRWIGSNYFQSESRVIIVSLNPGAGNSPEKRSPNEAFRQVLLDYKNGEATIKNLFDFQRQCIPKWGKPPGKFIKFYTEGMGLRLNDIALSNVAWCADAKNNWPPAMLSTCFKKYTSKLLKITKPDIIILSGAGTHKFGSKINVTGQHCEVIKTLHYAHREGYERETKELERVKHEIAYIKSKAKE